MLKKILVLQLRFDALLQQWAAPLFGLLLRGYVGAQFFRAGLSKIRDWDSTLALFQNEYQVPLLPPELAAWMGAGGELMLPPLLLLGLFSRPVALALFGVNLMAVISYPALQMLECPAALNDHFYWGVMLLAVVAFGPGRLALDNWLVRRYAS